jgi:DNA mismatch repair protein MutL
MDRKIQLLDDITINKIAAGEVIENPSSVVKELVENSLDAGAGEIVVEIHSGGRQLIRVSDDGCGMNRDDALLSLKRHATSKIRSVEDLFGVDTMGFRGEAIPSIASISKFSLSTSDESGEGSLLIVDGGNLIDCSSTIRTQGTTIEIKDLFFNVPVRKKFQRSPSYDTAEIQKMLSSIALSNPGVKFQLISNGKTVLTTPKARSDDPKSRFAERVEAVLGREFLAATCPFEVIEGESRVYGFIGLPSNHRPNRTGQFLFINRRGVQSIGIAYAIKEGYGTLLPSNRHPVFILQATLPGDLVDVNVHPQKREVRLRQEIALKDALCQAVQQAIGRADLTDQAVANDRFEFSPRSSVEPPRSPFSSFGSFSSGSSASPGASSGYRSYGAREIESKDVFSREDSKNRAFTSDPIETLAFSPVRAMTRIRVLGNLPPYILVDPSSLPEGVPDQFSSGLLCIEQRAAHKRILFERFQDRDASSSRKIEKTGLLIPLKVKLQVDQIGVLNQSADLIKQLGWEFNLSNDQSVTINSLPLYCKVSEAENRFISLIADFQLREEGLIDQNGEERWKRLAARCAIGNDQKLALEESESLLNQLFACRCPYYCPQGKPTMVVIGQDEIAKRFNN